jgi:hypothetical protein
MSATPLWLCAGVLLLVGCASPPSQSRRAGSERSRDSALGASKLPGAQGVRGALMASDSAAARNARLDSVATGQ